MEFFLFSILMAIVTVIFAIMAYFYTYVKHEREYRDISEVESSGLVTDDTGVSQGEAAMATPTEGGPPETGKPAQDESQI